MHDVLIIGGGVIGLTLALELAEQGVSVAVVDQGTPGQEASWAGAGMLPPGNPAQAASPEAQLRGGSHVLWSPFSARLLEETGVDNGYRRTGGLELRMAVDEAELEREIQSWHEEQVSIQPLTLAELREREPALGADVTAGYLLPEMGQIRNPRHLKALMAACSRRGVTLNSGCPVTGFNRLREKVCAVETPLGKHAAGQFVITAGSWSSRLLAEVGCLAEVYPVRGQMLLLSSAAPPLRHIVNVGREYVVPRPDGRTLVGSTEERVGFDKSNTAEAVQGLLEFGARVAPRLGAARFERCWSGLRPATVDGLPLLGRIPHTENLYVAAGHFRSGLQLSPMTSKLIADLMLGRTPSISLAPFAPDRFVSVRRMPVNP